MGRKYHHGNLRRALLDAALAIIREQGIHAVSMREAGRRAGVSSGAPYRHFGDKAALMTALAEEGEQLLQDMEQEQLELAGDDAVERFRSMGMAYVLFAARHPAHFRILHTPEFTDTPEMRAAVDARIARSQALLAQGTRSGDMAPDNAMVVLLAAQSLCYGLALMIVDGELERFGVGVEQVSEVTRAVTEVLGQGLLPR